MRLRHAIPLLALLLFTTVAATCNSSNVRSVGRGLEAGAIEARREFTSMQRAGEIDEDVARKFTAIFDEVESNAHSLTLIVNWEAMSREEKRRTIAQQIGHFASSAARLDEQGVLGIKSERARRRVEAYKRNFQRALGVLRIIEAAIPAAEQ